MLKMKEQESLLKYKMIEAWNNMGEGALATWFRNVLLNESFSVTASNLELTVTAILSKKIGMISEACMERH